MFFIHYFVNQDTLLYIIVYTPEEAVGSCWFITSPSVPMCCGKPSVYRDIQYTHNILRKEIILFPICPCNKTHDHGLRLSQI